MILRLNSRIRRRYLTAVSDRATDRLFRLMWYKLVQPDSAAALIHDLDQLKQCSTPSWFNSTLQSILNRYCCAQAQLCSLHCHQKPKTGLFCCR